MRVPEKGDIAVFAFCGVIKGGEPAFYPVGVSVATIDFVSFVHRCYFLRKIGKIIIVSLYSGYRFPGIKLSQRFGVFRDVSEKNYIFAAVLSIAFSASASIL